MHMAGRPTHTPRGTSVNLGFPFFSHTTVSFRLSNALLALLLDDMDVARGGPPAPPSDPLGITSLVAALGGNSQVLAVYDARAGVTLDDSGNLAAWDDARGSGFGPQRVGYGAPKPAVVNSEIITDGAQNYHATADVSPVFDLSKNRTLIWISTLQAGGWPYALNIQDVPLAAWESVGVSASGVPLGNGFVGSRYSGTDTRIAPSADRRMWVVNYSGPSPSAGNWSGDATKWIHGHSRIPNTISGSAATGPLGSRYLSVGNLLDRGLFTVTKERALIIVDHSLSAAEYDAVAAWATTHHSTVKDVGSAGGSIICAGNSLTYGLTASDPATTSYPALLAANFPTFDVSNFGISGRLGRDMANAVATEILPLYDASRPQNIYVYWEGINDLAFLSPYSLSDVIAHMHDTCLAVKNRGMKAVVLPCIPNHSTASDGRDADRVAYNNYIRANWPSFATALADVDAIPELSDYTNTAYFSGDGIHLNDPGYNLIANHATHGVTQAINSIL